MPSTILWFATDDFEDSDEDRDARINEEIGGAALAKWLSAELQTKGLTASAPWAEDHGWEFDVRDGADTYLIVCTIEDGQDGDREACVQVHKGKPGRDSLDASDPLLRQITVLLEGRGAAPRIE
ncbi:MAG: hypothetical protein R3D44_01680 [Hyphomicrobiaceae bacterium]